MRANISMPNMRIRGQAFAAVSSRLARWCGRSGLAIFFPPTCPGCGSEISTTAADDPLPICQVCIDRLPIIGEASCHRCGAPVAGAAARERCYHCSGVRLWFDEAVALGLYEGLLRDWLLRMKDRRGESLALTIAERFYQHHADRLVAIAADVVIPVPMHWRRRLVRGTNSAAILAERLADRLRLPLACDLVCRIRRTQPQFGLGAAARRDNVRNAFTVRRGYHLNSARVLLVDDILTTGSTASEIARTLKRSGAEYVAIGAAARAIVH